MATRSYVSPAEYDPADTEFTVATIDGNPYLQMGALDRDDSALFRSLIDGYAGFFQDGQQVAAVRITARYDATKGVQLESLPRLTIGGGYHVRFTQARPGRDGIGGSNRRTGGMQPFGIDGMMGRHYGPMIPFNRYNKIRMLPYSGEPMTGKPSGEPMLGRFPKKRQSGEDILDLFDGIPEMVRDYMVELIEDRLRPDGPELIELLNGLPIGSRLQFSWLDGAPTIPLNTASWHGAWRSETAYVSGSIVTDGGNVFIYIVDIPATNTVRPAADTASRVEHLDVGSPLDITNVTSAGLVFTFTRRDGSQFTLEITEAHIYHAFLAMSESRRRSMFLRMEEALTPANRATYFFKLFNALSDQQRNVVRLATGAAAASHNHDSRYYTEAESNSRFAPRSHNHDSRYYTEAESNSRYARTSHTHPAPTAAQVLTALQAMTTAQENASRDAIGAIKAEISEEAASDWVRDSDAIFIARSVQTHRVLIIKARVHPSLFTTPNNVSDGTTSFEYIKLFTS